MPRALRFVPVPHTLVEVTTRTVQSRLLLKPCPAVNQAILGVLGRAQQLHRMTVHLAVVMSNHYHLILAPTDAEQLAGFMGFVNSNIAREVGRLVDWKEKFWGRRYEAILVSDELEAQVGRLRYFLANCVKEHLVESPLDWPGIHCARTLVDGHRLEGTWLDRTGLYRARKRRKRGEPPVQEKDFITTQVLELTPLPCLAGMDVTRQRQFVAGLMEEVVAEGVAARKEKGMMALGAKAVAKQHPHSQPKNSKKSPAPRFHTFAVAIRKALSEAYSLFTAAYRIASARLRDGDRSALFPDGCFPPALPFCAVPP